jgi:hypothetical protein
MGLAHDNSKLEKCEGGLSGPQRQRKTAKDFREDAGTQVPAINLPTNTLRAKYFSNGDRCLPVLSKTEKKLLKLEQEVEELKKSLNSALLRIEELTSGSHPLNCSSEKICENFAIKNFKTKTENQEDEVLETNIVTSVSSQKIQEAKLSNTLDSSESDENSSNKKFICKKVKHSSDTKTDMINIIDQSKTEMIDLTDHTKIEVVDLIDHTKIEMVDLTDQSAQTGTKSCIGKLKTSKLQKFKIKNGRGENVKNKKFNQKCIIEKSTQKAPMKTAKSLKLSPEQRAAFLRGEKIFEGSKFVLLAISGLENMRVDLMREVLEQDFYLKKNTFGGLRYHLPSKTWFFFVNTKYLEQQTKDAIIPGPLPVRKLTISEVLTQKDFFLKFTEDIFASDKQFIKPLVLAAKTLNRGIRERSPAVINDVLFDEQYIIPAPPKDQGDASN